LAEPNPNNGEWWFTVGHNVMGADSGYLIFVFGDLECQCAVATVDEFAGIDERLGIYPGRRGWRPTFLLGPGSLRLRVEGGEMEDVSHWLGAFEQIAEGELGPT
jgi:hypothetical protein